MLESSLEVRSAIIYATLIDVVAIVPVFFIQGLSGAFFQPLAISYGLAVLASLLVALTVTPAMAYLLLRNAKVERRSSPIARVLQERYQAVLARIIGSARPAFAMVAGISVVAGRRGVAARPVAAAGLQGTRLPHALGYGSRAPPTPRRSGSRPLRASSCARSRASRTVARTSARRCWPTRSSASISARTGSRSRPDVDYDKTHAAIQKVVDGYPGLRRDVQTYLKERIREVLTGTSDAIVVRIFGPDLGVLDEKAKELEEVLKGIPGTKDVHRQLQTEIAQVQVEVDLAKAQAYGIKPGDVRRAAVGHCSRARRSVTSSSAARPTTSTSGRRPRSART